MEAPQAAKTRKMVDSLKLIRESRDLLFSQDQSEAAKERTKKAWEELLQKTTSIGWTNSSQSSITLKRKWNALNSETQKSIRAKIEKAKDSGVKAIFSQKEEIVMQILNLDVEISMPPSNASLPGTSNSVTNHMETQTEESLPKKPITRSHKN